jgi:hypothetical protein
MLSRVNFPSTLFFVIYVCTNSNMDFSSSHLNQNLCSEQEDRKTCGLFPKGVVEYNIKIPNGNETRHYRKTWGIFPKGVVEYSVKVSIGNVIVFWVNIGSLLIYLYRNQFFFTILVMITIDFCSIWSILIQSGNWKRTDWIVPS